MPISSHAVAAALFAALCFGAVANAGETPEVVFEWDAKAWLGKRNPQLLDGQLISIPDGTQGARATSTPRGGQNPFNHVFVTRANLEGGREYTAAVTFTVVQPTAFPHTFYLYARNSAGNQFDHWANWIGLPGETRTLFLPMNLQKIDGRTRTLTLGIGKTGSIDLHRVVVYDGATFDGKTRPKVIPAEAGAKPAAAALPENVSVATGYTDFSIAPPATGKTISLADYGFTATTRDTPADVAVKNAEALQKAINDAKAAGASTLSMPGGVYRVASRGQITLDGLADFTFDGNGGTIVLEKLSKDGPAFFINNCNRFVMRNVNFDWNWDVTPIASLGIASNVSADRTEFDLAFTDLDAAQTALVAKTPWRSVFEMDPERLYRVTDAIIPVTKDASITPGGAPNVLRVKVPKPVPVVEGKSYCVRHLYYEMTAFMVAESKDLSFNGVTIHSMPGMGWYFSGGMENFELVDCHVRRVPGNRYPLTTAADGFHANQFVRNFRVENCTVTGCGDDAMNFHTEVYQGEIVIDPADRRKVRLMHAPAWHLRLKAGDPVEFYDSDFGLLNKGGEVVSRTVASSKSDNAGKPQTTDVVFTEPVPEGLTPQSILMNGRFETSNVLIRNCRMENFSGRGILISARNATIENNVIDHALSSGINLEADIKPPLWSEGRGVSNVLIRNNTFENCNRQVRYEGAILYTNTRMPYGQSTATLFDRVTIEGNTFLNAPGPIVYLSNAQNLVVRNNEIKTAGPEYVGRFTGAFYLQTTRDAAVGGNTWAGGGAEQSGVILDAASTANIAADGNTLVGVK